jgi:heme A synthase
MIGPLLLIFLLGGLQGFMGWYMVKSGLDKMPHVSHFRLAAHQGYCIAISGFAFLDDVIYKSSQKENDWSIDKLTDCNRYRIIIAGYSDYSGSFRSWFKSRVFRTPIFL